MFKHAFIAFNFLGILILASGCSRSDDGQLCDHSSVISPVNNICLSIEHNGLSNDQISLIETKISAGMAAIGALMPIDNLRIRIVQNPNLVIPEIGMGGYNPGAQEVILAIDAGFSDLEATLEDNLIPQLAHEVHHAKRRRSAGYGSTLLEAVISEGLADHFSIEVSGIAPPPWTVALDAVQLQQWIDTAGNSWDQPYDHLSWFLGTDPDIPKWTGYSIGFELVKNYLLDHPDRKPSDLHNEPAGSFAP